MNELIDENDAPTDMSENGIKMWFLDRVQPNLILPFSEIDGSTERGNITKHVYTLLHSISHALISEASIINLLTHYPKAFIVGGAGTGKTWIGIKKIQRCLQEGGEPLYLCYNKALADSVRKIFDTKIECFNFDAFLFLLLKGKALEAPERNGCREYFDLLSKSAEDLFNRMKISMDFCDELNEKYGKDGIIHIFSFPMKYIPLKDLDRSYIGTNWNAKYLRAVQRMLIPTQGKGVSSRSFFEADFGKSAEEFLENLAMPEDLLGLRGHFVKKKDEDKNEQKTRFERWTVNHKRIDEWRRLYRSLSEKERKEFISIIGNNDFSITNFKNCKTDAQKILFVFNMSYLGICRNLEALGEVVLNYFTSTFELFYDELLRYLVTTKNVQFSCLQH